MMTYSEEQVKNLIQSHLDLEEENAYLKGELSKLKDQLSKEALQRESAEKKYDDLCEGCIKFYIATQDIVVDTLFVQASVPRFMNQDDFTTGIIQHLVHLLKAEREKTILHKTSISDRKECT